MSTMFIAVPAQASTILTSRSATLGSSTAGASTTVAFSFKTTTTNLIKAIMIQMCTTPLEGSCTTDGTSSLSSATLSAQGGNLTGFAVGAGTPPVPTANTLYIFNASGITPVVATAQTLTLSNVTIPNTANHEFYFRVTTYQNYNGSGGLTENDFGGVAVSTGTTMSESATVQESLVFALGTSGASCAAIAGGGTVTMTNGSPMGTATDTYGTGKMCANTNASAGYTIAYTGTAFAGGGSTFTSPVAQFTATAGTANFGFNLKADTMPIGSVATGADPVGGTGVCTVNANYCTANKYSYDASGTPVTIANSGATPSADTVYTMNFVAEIDNTIKTGVYTATQTFIATGTF
jgi:hypothetical protein